MDGLEQQLVSCSCTLPELGIRRDSKLAKNDVLAAARKFLEPFELSM